MNEYIDESIEISDEYKLKRLKKFNTGAFFFTWIWGFANGVYTPCYLSMMSTFLIIVGFIIPFVGLLGIIGLFLSAVILGIKGNDWSYNSKDWDSFEKFENTQKKWGQAANIVIILGVFFLFFGSCNKTKYASNIKIDPSKKDAINKNVLRGILATRKYTENISSGEELVNFLYKSLDRRNRAHYEKYNKNSLKTKDNSLMFTFYKERNCDIKKKNCYIISAVRRDNGVERVKTYYDYSGQTSSFNLKTK